MNLEYFLIKCIGVTSVSKITQVSRCAVLYCLCVALLNLEYFKDMEFSRQEVENEKGIRAGDREGETPCLAPKTSTKICSRFDHRWASCNGLLMGTLVSSLIPGQPGRRPQRTVLLLGSDPVILQAPLRSAFAHRLSHRQKLLGKHRLLHRSLGGPQRTPADEKPGGKVVKKAAPL